MKQEYETRGYKVFENGPVYYTQDMDRTIEWFETVLGWYGTVDARNAKGKAIFAGIAPIPNEITEKEKLTYIGLSLFLGEPSQGVAAYIVVDNARQVYEYIMRSGWREVSKVVEQPWGGLEFTVKTIDGSILRITSY
ncbi:MAG: hypothetical protein Q4G58_00875 [bacterium]|nr:hypothetical protein [bacterium]